MNIILCTCTVQVNLPAFLGKFTCTFFRVYIKGIVYNNFFKKTERNTAMTIINLTLKNKSHCSEISLKESVLYFNSSLNNFYTFQLLNFLLPKLMAPQYKQNLFNNKICI